MNADEIGPDLSHLTPEERQIIQDVINRQKQDEKNSQVRENPIPLEKQRLQNQSQKPQPAQLSQQVPSQGKFTQFKPNVVSQNNSLPAQKPADATASNPLESVASIVKSGITSLTEPTCKLCKKTKFADTLGHQCQKCKIRICSKCGMQTKLPKNFFNSQNSKDCQIIPCWICLQCLNNDQRLSSVIYNQQYQIDIGSNVYPLKNTIAAQFPNQYDANIGSFTMNTKLATMEQIQENYYNQMYQTNIPSNYEYLNGPQYNASEIGMPSQQTNQNLRQENVPKVTQRNPLDLAVGSVFSLAGKVSSELLKTPTNTNANNNSSIFINQPGGSQNQSKGILEGITGIFTSNNNSNNKSQKNNNLLPTMDDQINASQFQTDQGQIPIPSWRIEDASFYQDISGVPAEHKPYQDHGFYPSYDHRAYSVNAPILDPITGYQYSKVPSRYRDQLREHKLHYLSFSSSEGEDTFEDGENQHRYRYQEQNQNRPYVTVTDDEDPASQFYISTNQYRSNHRSRKYPRSLNESRRLMPNISAITAMEKVSRPSNFRKLTMREFNPENTSILSEPDYFPEDQVTWRLSQNEKFLIGHMVLFRPPDIKSNRNIISAIGLRLLIGEQHPLVQSRFGTFVSKVKWGSPADMVGHIRPGDEIVEWNKINLINLPAHEVNQILLTSRNFNRIEIILQRPSDCDHPFESHHSSIQSRNYPKEIIDFDPIGYNSDMPDINTSSQPDKPSINLKFWYNSETDELIVNVLSARHLPCKMINEEYYACNTYCKLDLLPYVKGRSQRSRLIPNNPNPKWYQTFTFGPFRNQSVGEHDLEITVWDVDRTLDRSALICQVIINLNYADLTDIPYWFPLQTHSLDARPQTPVLMDEQPVQKFHRKHSENQMKQSTISLERLLRPGPIGIRQRSAQRLMEDETLSDTRYFSRRGYQERLEDDFHDSDISEISDISDLSKLSIGSDFQRSRNIRKPSHHQQLHLAPKKDFNENYDRNEQECYQGNIISSNKMANLSLCSESSFSTVSGMGDYNNEVKKNESIFKNANKSSENVTNEKNEQNINEVRKRRPSIGQKFSNVLGLSRKSSSTSNLDKKSRASFQRSSEVIPAHVKPTDKPVTGYTAPAYTSEHGKISVFQQPTNQKSQETLSKNMEEPGIPSSNEGTNASGEAHVGEFVDGLGPGQLVGRQVLGMPCLGEIQLSFIDRKGKLEVDVIRARGLQQRCSGKVLPAPYVKLHLLEGKQSVEKLRTTNQLVRTLDPLYQQQLTFNTPYHGKILQVSVWGEFGRMEKKIFMGMCEIVLDDLEISNIVFGWYKLFGMIASNLQNFTSKNL